MQSRVTSNGRWQMIQHALFLLLLALISTAQAKIPRSSQVTRDFQKQNPCPTTGKTTGACPGQVKDHIKSLCAGGTDSVDNMQWQTVEESRIKDIQEKRECAMNRASAHKKTGVKKSHVRHASTDQTCFTGPRGGRYRIVNGRKQYGC